MLIATSLNLGLSLFSYEREHLNRLRVSENVPATQSHEPTLIQQSQEHRGRHGMAATITLITGVMLLTSALVRFLFQQGGAGFTKKRLGLILLSGIIGVQVLFTLSNVYYYHSLGIEWEPLLLTATPSTVISVLVSMELMFILFLVISKHYDLHPEPEKNVEPAPRDFTASPHELIRPNAFLLMFVAYLTQSFLPLYAEELYTPFWGVAKDVAIGIPMTAKMLMTVLILFPGGVWMEKRGWHEPFLVGIVILAMASFLSGIATSTLQLVFYRGMMGAGYGLSWMACLGFVVLNTNYKTKGKGFANVVAGIFSGIICGAATGAVLGEVLGYSIIYHIVMIGLVLPVFYFLFFMRSYSKKPDPPAVEKSSVTTKQSASSSSPLSWQQLLRCFLNRNIFAVFLMNLVPTQICVIGLLYFVTPIYLQSIEVPHSQVGIIFIIYGLCMIYVAPFFNRFMDQNPDKKIYISIGGLIGSLGITSLFLSQNLLGVMLMVLLLGISTSLTSSPTAVFILNLKATYVVGMGKMMAIQRIADKVGAALGPLILGMLIATLGINQAIFAIGIFYFVMTLGFIVFAESQKPIPLPGMEHEHWSWKHLVTFLRNIGNKWYLDELPPEKQYGYAMAASLALTSAADGALTDREILVAEEKLCEMKDIQDYMSIEEAHQAFELYANELVNALHDKAHSFEQTVELLLRQVPHLDREDWKHNIVESVQHVAEAGHHYEEPEKQMIQRIRQSLWKEEIDYIHTVVAALVLISVTDGVIQESEIQAAEEHLKEIPEIQEYLSFEETHQIFSDYVNQLKSYMNNEDSSFELGRGILFHQIKAIPEEVRRERLIEIVRKVASADGGLLPEEEQVLEKIRGLLSQPPPEEGQITPTDWKTLFSNLKYLLKQLLPTHLSPEKQYGNAIVAVLAIIACSDRKLTKSEIRLAYRYIDSTYEIKHFLSVNEARQTFHLYVEQLLEKSSQNEVFTQPIDFVLRKIPNIKKEEWRNHLMKVAMDMAAADGILEEGMPLIEKIGNTLWHSEEQKFGLIFNA